MFNESAIEQLRLRGNCMFILSINHNELIHNTFKTHALFEKYMGCVLIRCTHYIESSRASTRLLEVSMVLGNKQPVHGYNYT